MPATDLALNELLKKAPILEDSEFLNEFPEVTEFAFFIYRASRSAHATKTHYKPFQKAGVDNIQDYLTLLQQRNPEVVRIYNDVRPIFEV